MFPGGSDAPVNLYTFDVDPSYLPLEDFKERKTKSMARKERVSARLIRDKYKD